MRIHFGMAWDGPVWPEWKEGETASVGEAWAGPQGLLSILETQLGLGVEIPPEALRIRRYMELVDAIGDADAFYAASFDADAWAAARELLQMRDELVRHGWSGEAGPDAPERIRALAAIEHAATAQRATGQAGEVATGFADRLRRVQQALKASPRIAIRELELVDAEALLPSPLQALIGGLRDVGVQVRDGGFAGGAPEEVVLLESERSWLLAESVAGWLASGETGGDAVILCEGDAALLDQALHALGLPATGQVETSPKLGLFQLLPLVLENIWKPVRISRLMALLSAPAGPIPGWAVRHLIGALSEAPGLEGERWRKALASIADDRARFLVADGMGEVEAVRQGRAFADDLDHWLRVSRVDEGCPAPASVVEHAVRRLEQHLAKLVAMPDAEASPDRQAWHSAALVALGHCRDMRGILATMREIERPLLEQIVDDVIGPARPAYARREAAPWGVLSHPGGLTGPVDTLVWWNFVGRAAPRRNVWSRRELDWLADRDVRLDAPEQARALELAQWARLMGGARRLILCRPFEVQGEPAPIHPFWFEIEADEALAGRTRVILADELFTAERPELLGRALPFEAAPATKASDVTPVKVVASNDYRPEKLSPSSLSTLFGCPFKWLVGNLGIAASEVMVFPEGDAMTGLLAHKVLEDVFSQSPAPTEEEARARARESVDRRISEMAAELLLPEHKAEINDIRKRIEDAAADLTRLFAEAGFVRFKCEEWIRTELDGIPVNGRADMIAFMHDREGGGGAHIIDFKYSFSNYYRNKIEEGADVQLIAYARMLGEPQTPVAYYLAPKREMVTVFPSFGAPTVTPGVPVHEGWERVRKTFATMMQGIRAGRIMAAGVLDEDARKELADERRERGEIWLDPPCDFCDFGALCGRNGGRG